MTGRRPPRSLGTILCAVLLLGTLPPAIAAQTPDSTRSTGAGSLPPGHPRIGQVRQALYAPGANAESRAAWLRQFSDRAGQDGSEVIEQGSIAGSVLGAGLGLVAGVAGAAVLASASGGDLWDQLAVAGISVLILEPIGVGVGAHLGNGGHGRVGSAIGASYASLLIGALVLNNLASDEGAGPMLSFTLIGLQIGSAVAAERGSARRRGR